MTTDEEENAIRQLGEMIGYGRIMQLASEIWSKKDPVGALTVGGCRGDADRVFRVDEKLAGQLQRSIELNARMVTRLQKLARDTRENVYPGGERLADQIINISHDKDPD